MEAFPDLDLAVASRFVATLGLTFDEITERTVTGRVVLGPQHHGPWGAVHGGVYSTVVERAASVGASWAVVDRGLRAVGVHNATDVFAQVTAGRVDVRAEAVHQGDLHQVWVVDILAADDGTRIARGQLRLQNIDHQT